MKSLYPSVTFAALVAGSSLTLLTGAQADEVFFGPRTGTPTFNFSNNTTITPPPFQFQNNATSGPASFNGLTGTFTWANTTVRVSGLSADGATFDTFTNAQGNPAPVSFSVNFLANGALTGTVLLDQLQGANTLTPKLFGTYTVATATGIFSGAFPMNSTEPFEWTLITVASNTRTPEECSRDVVGCTQFTPASFSGDTGILGVPGPIVGAGLPGLIAALGGLVAVARRRRKQLA